MVRTTRYPLLFIEREDPRRADAPGEVCDRGYASTLLEQLQSGRTMTKSQGHPLRFFRSVEQRLWGSVEKLFRALHHLRILSVFGQVFVGFSSVFGALCEGSVA